MLRRVFHGIFMKGLFNFIFHLKLDESMSAGLMLEKLCEKLLMKQSSQQEQTTQQSQSFNFSHEFENF
jgi:hypothetical protein